MCKGQWTEPLKEGNRWRDLAIEGLKWATQQYVVTVWTGLIWTKIFAQWWDLSNKVIIETSGHKRWETGYRLIG